MMGAGLLNATRSFKLVALKFCFPGSITSFHRFVYVFFMSMPLPVSGVTINRILD